MPRPGHTPLVTNPYYGPGGQSGIDASGGGGPSSTQGQTGPGDTKVNQILSNLRSALGGPYAHWPAPGGYKDWSPQTVKSKGLSCSEYIAWGAARAGVNIPGSTYALADAIGKKPIETGKSYPVGTILVSTSGPEGHVAMVSGPNNKLIQSDTHQGINESKTLASQQKYVNYQYAGTVAQIGTGNYLTNNEGQLADPVTSAIQNLINNLGAGIANGLVMALKYIYGYMILRPWDFICGFSYELVIAVKNDYYESEEQRSNDKNALARNNAAGGN